MKILVAVDGSRYTKRMLAYLAAHDELLGSRHQYTVLTVVPALPSRAAGVLDRAVVKSHYEDEAERIFKPIRAFLARQGIEPAYLSRVGTAGELIARQAAAGRFDLLMMGSHGHGSLSGLVMGSVAAKVLASCRTPLLLVR
ncbi:MAG TPA: universal stress protein [Burkholderiaceae bacterium]|mgnify:FL=1|nr:universal stress protein [Burkholderiaceae bacterium]